MYDSHSALDQTNKELSDWNLFCRRDLTLSKLRTASLQVHRIAVALLGPYEGGTDIEGRTPLMRAATLGQIEVVDALLGAGMCLDAVDHVGRSALHYAAEGKRNFHLPVVQTLLREASTWPALPA